MLYNYLKEDYSRVGIGLFSQASSDKMRENGLKLHQERFRLDVWRNLFYKLKELYGIGIGCPGKLSQHPWRF